MLAKIIAELGPWSWWILGLILLGAEILAPGIFLLWIGLAAIAIGAISFFLWDSAVWGWQVQLLAFAALALLSAYIGHRMVSKKNADSDQPMLNRRLDNLIGRTGQLVEALENGCGRIRLDDTLWVVTGPDMPAAARVRIVGVADGELQVEAA